MGDQTEKIYQSFQSEIRNDHCDVDEIDVDAVFSNNKRNGKVETKEF